MQFVAKTSSLIDLHLMYKNKKIANTCNTKFLRLTLDSTFSWKNHIDTIVPNLEQPVSQLGLLSHFYPKNHFSYFHSIMTYGLVFCGNSYHCNTVFKLQKGIIRIVILVLLFYCISYNIICIIIIIRSL
jgi:hypothetical protein